MWNSWLSNVRKKIISLDWNHQNQQQGKGRMRSFICLPLLTRFSAGLPPYIKAKIGFLTIPALVRASAEKTLCKICREAILRMVMKTINPSARLIPSSNPLSCWWMRRPQLHFRTRKTFICLSVHFSDRSLNKAAFDIIRCWHGHFYHFVITYILVFKIKHVVFR